MKNKILIPKNTALILIDVQKGFDFPGWGKRNNRYAELNMSRILSFWRKTKKPVIHIKHNSLNPRSPLSPNQKGNEIKNIVSPLNSELVITKHVNSAFIETNLEKVLKAKNIHSVVIVGLTTDHCVSTTTRMAGNLGFTTFIVSDATATFGRVGFDSKNYSAKKMHDTALVSLQEEFATVVNTSSLLSAHFI